MSKKKNKKTNKRFNSVKKKLDPVRIRARELYLTPDPKNPAQQLHSYSDIIKIIFKEFNKKITPPNITYWKQSEDWDFQNVHSTKSAVIEKENIEPVEEEDYQTALTNEKIRYFIELDSKIKKAFTRLDNLLNSKILERDQIAELKALTNLIDIFQSIIHKRFEQDVRYAELQIRQQESNARIQEIKAKTKVYESLIGDNTDYNEIVLSMDNSLIKKQKQESGND